MRWRLLRTLVTGLLVSVARPDRSAAQTCTAPVPAGTCTVATSTTLTIGLVVRLVLSSIATPLTAPAEADYDAGFAANAGPTATVQANTPWRLQISAGAATWTAISTEPGVVARPGKPAGDLTWSAAAGGPFAGLSVTPVDARTGVATAGSVGDFFFRTLYSWGLDTPGSYALTVVFTLMAP